MERIYLDYNASAPLLPEAWEAMAQILQPETAYNASSTHHFGRIGQKAINDARLKVANLVGATPNQVIFNSGATEGNNTILNHFSKSYPDDTILISAIEHPSISYALNHLNNVKTIPVDKHGVIRVDALEELLQNNKVSLVSCMFANNETGAIQNVSDISEIAHKHGSLFHCDAAQAAGRIPIDIKDKSIDFLTISSHKIGGPQGVGALIIGICGQSPALIFGGGQEKYLRAGTQNVAGITAFGAASEYTLKNTSKYKKLEQLRDKLEHKLKEISHDIIIHSEEAQRLPNTSLFSAKGINAQSALMALDLEGIAASGGSACSSGSINPSDTLKAMGLNEEIASSALRVSMGWATKDSDLDAFLCAWEKLYSRIK